MFHLPTNQGMGMKTGKDHGFCDLVQSLEGVIPISEMTKDNDPHLEFFSNNSKS